MKQLTTTLNGHTIHMVDDVPQGATKIRITNIQVDNDLICDHPDGYIKHLASLPSGNWKLLGLASDISEEIAAGLVDEDGTYMNDGEHEQVLRKDYENDELKEISAVESLHSFVKSHHFNPETTVILIKE